MSRNKYGMNSVGKDKPEMEETFGNTGYVPSQEVPLPDALKPWLKSVKEFQEKEFKSSLGNNFEDWRPRGTGDPKGPPPHWNKKDGNGQGQS